jgi:iron-sulfur cluster repair protein YtfE (RIC family)
MSEVSARIHNHHDRILRDLREQSAAFVATPLPANSASLLTLLRDELLPHAEAEEHEIYPLIDRICRATHDRATASTAVDHEFIGEWSTGSKGRCTRCQRQPERTANYS